MPMIWWFPVVALGLLVVVSIYMVRRLAVELRETAQCLASIAGTVAKVQRDAVRARSAIDSLETPSLRQLTLEKALSLTMRWAARRVLP